VAKQKVYGKWSPIYAQTLMVELENGVRFLTNFRYNVKKQLTPNPLNENDLAKFDKISTSSEEAFNSQCNETMVGFVMDYGNAL